jgi:hypothetical protein
MNSIDSKPKIDFRAGDDVVLALGTYQGTDGVFLGFKEDANWANIRERDGSVRCHPVAWLADGTAAKREALVH